MHEDSPTAEDLPRDPGTLYAVRNTITGGFIRCGSYEEACVLWQNGRVIYTKNLRGPSSAREWAPIDPPA